MVLVLVRIMVPDADVLWYLMLVQADTCTYVLLLVQQQVVHTVVKISVQQKEGGATSMWMACMHDAPSFSSFSTIPHHETHHMNTRVVL